MSRLTQQMEDAVHVRRPRERTQSDVASTLLGAMGHEVAAPQMLRRSQLVRSPYQKRSKRDSEYMENLVESIRLEGLLDPIIVRPIVEPQGCYTVTPPFPRYELVAGHHRVDAFEILGRDEIPAFIRRLTDAEAARALTSENTVRKDLDDWELYKHAQMLREAGAVPSNTQLARVLNINRAVVPQLDGFGVLPLAAHQLLDDHPGLVGYHLAHKLKPYCPQHAVLVFDALCLLAKGKLTQAAVPAWIDEKINPRQTRPRKDLQLGSGVRLIVNADGARVSGNIDYDRLHRLIEAHLADLLVAG